MSKTHNPYLRLFTRDIEGSPKVNSLSMEASGLYFRLLNRLTEPPMPGSIAIHDWDPHNTWQRSLTQQCLATPDKQDRLQYFAKLLSRYFQWKSGDILHALRELYFYGIIVIEDDRLIQPRMYRDNGYKLQSDPVDSELIDRATGAYISSDNDDADDYKNHLKKKNKKSDDNSRTRVHAPHALSNESENNIIDNDIDDNDKEEKENKKKNVKTVAAAQSGVGNTPKSENKGADGDKSDEVVDYSNDGDKTSQKPQKEVLRPNKQKNVALNPPTLEEVQAYFEERRRQGKPFIYITPDGFYDACCQSGWTLKDGKPIRDWQARCRTFENFRKEHDGKPIANYNHYETTENRTPAHTVHGAAAGRSAASGSDSPSNSEVYNQSMRIISRLRAGREADAGGNTQEVRDE